MTRITVYNQLKEKQETTQKKLEEEESKKLTWERKM